jgi:protein-disulfide isomerase
VLADYEDGVRHGVSGTPTFYINGIELVGAQPLGAFEDIIDEELGR